MSDGMGTVERSGDTASIRFERTIGAPLQAVWGLLTTGIAGWLAPGVIDPQEGGPVMIDFGDGEVVTGTVVEWAPPHRLVYTWHITGEPESTTTWELRSDGAATRLTLVHVALPSGLGAGYGAGWHAHLDRLDAAARGHAGPDWQALFDQLIGDYAG
jgi:uncharacterized protein YndB with AHSA1/START domain